MSEVSSTSFQVSARKYRPQKLSELLGQDVLVKALTSGIEQNRLPHGFIFTGIRGVGKTTTARIIARSLNCIGVDGQGQETIEPCGQCEHCVAIKEGRHMDVVEMDGATHTGVDDVREIIESSQYKPVSARYKIFIIDEVHMLSKSAFNALLKTLEEPPARVKFIFATTEIDKVPLTVLSRCMRFDLSPLTETQLEKLFQGILEKEGRGFEPGALQLLAIAAKGSARDGLSLLDQALTIQAGDLTTQTVREMLGVKDPTQLMELFRAVFSGKAPDAYTAYHQLVSVGASPLNLLEELAKLYETLNLFLIMSPDEKAGLQPGYPDEMLQEIKSWAETTSVAEVQRLWQGLIQGIKDLGYAPNETAAGAMIITRVCYLSHLPLPQEILNGKAFLAPPAEKKNLGTSAVAPEKTQDSPSLAETALAETPVAPAAPKALEPTPVAVFPGTFQDFILELKAGKSPLLYAQVCSDLKLLKIEDEALTVCPKPGTPADLLPQLRAWTQETFGAQAKILVGEGEGKTWNEHTEQAETEKAKVITEDPVVKATLEAFPGATIEDVQTNDKDTEAA